MQNRERVLALAGVLILTALVYAPTLSFTFAADDASQILGNPRIHSVSYVPSYFTTHVWGHLSMGTGNHGAAYYRPVFLLWELATYLVVGTSTVGWHLSAILLQVLATLLVYWLAMELTSDWITAAIAASLFGLHPIHVEAVTWVSGATEPLVAIPLIGAMICWIRAHRCRRAVLYRTGAVVLYGVALLAKETAVVFPLVLLFYELFVRRDRQRLTLRLTPFAIVTVAYFAIRQVTLRDTYHTDIPWLTLMLTWPSVGWFYVQHLLAPFGLSLLYDLGVVDHFSASQVLIPGLCAFAVVALVLWLLRGKRMEMFAAVWALLMILPPLYLRAFNTVEIVHDRYLYLPSVGFCLLIALLLRRLRMEIALGAAAVLVIVYGAFTIIESRPWQNEAILFAHTVEKAPRSWHAKRQLAFALGRTSHCQDALPMLAEIIDTTPADHMALFAMGACYFHLGQPADAESMMRRTVAIHPTFQQPYLLLAALLLEQGKVDEAEQQWREAASVQVGPNPEKTFHLVRAEILRARGDLAGAIEQYRMELEIQPDNDAIEGAMAAAQRKLSR